MRQVTNNSILASEHFGMNVCRLSHRACNLFFSQPWLIASACAGLVHSAAIAQVGDLIDVPSPPPLPAPGMLDQHVLEQPLPLAIGLVVLSLVLGAIARARTTPQQRKLLGLVSVFAFVAGIGAYVAGKVVQTPRERMMQACSTLVHDVAKANVQGVRSGMTQQCTLTYFEAPLGLPAQGILDRVAQQFANSGVYALEDYKIREIEAVEDREGFGRVQVKVWAKAKAGFPVNSWWRLDYVQENGTWKANAISAISISGMRAAGGR